MKALLKAVVVLVVCLAAVLVVLRITGLPPKNRRPGLWLKGDLVTAPVKDWSFAKQYPIDQVQVRPWYGIAHSVNTGFIVADGQLYLTSGFPAGMPYPQGKSWVAAVVRDPHVRIKFGNQLFDCLAYPVSDPAERARIMQESREERHNAPPSPPQPGAMPASAGMTLHLFRVTQE